MGNATVDDDDDETSVMGSAECACADSLGVRFLRDAVEEDEDDDMTIH